MKKLTHYELRKNRTGRYEGLAKKFREMLTNDTKAFGFAADSKSHSDEVQEQIRNASLSEIPGLWMMIMMKQGGRICNSKNQTLNLFSHVKSHKELGHLLDALLHEVYDRLYGDYANPDGTYSINNIVFLSQQFLFHQNSIAEFFTESGASTAAEVSFQCLSFERAGKREYQVSPGLAEKLCHTELRGLQSEDVRLPFPSLYITVPKEAGFSIYNDTDRQWHELEGVYITEDKYSRQYAENVGSVAKDMKSEILASDKIPYAEREIKRSWSIMAVGGPGKDDKGKPIPDDDALFFFRIYFPEGDSLEDCVSDLNGRRRRLNGQGCSLKDMDDKWDAIFRWCINVIIYATNSDPDEAIFADKDMRKLWERIQNAPENSKIRKNLQKKLDAITGSRITVLGKNITVDRTKAVSDGDFHSAHRKMTVRTRVAGHWRRVRHGKGRLQRRMTFVEPFWRGPELGQTVAKAHVLK